MKQNCLIPISSTTNFTVCKRSCTKCVYAKVQRYPGLFGTKQVYQPGSELFNYNKFHIKAST